MAPEHPQRDPGNPLSGILYEIRNFAGRQNKTFLDTADELRSEMRRLSLNKDETRASTSGRRQEDFNSGNNRPNTRSPPRGSDNANQHALPSASRINNNNRGHDEVDMYYGHYAYG